MTDDTEDIPTREELRQAMEKAIRAGFMKPNGDDTFSITDTGKEWFETLLLSSSNTLH